MTSDFEEYQHSDRLLKTPGSDGSYSDQSDFGGGRGLTKYGGEAYKCGPTLVKAQYELKQNVRKTEFKCERLEERFEEVNEYLPVSTIKIPPKRETYDMQKFYKSIAHFNNHKLQHYLTQYRDIQQVIKDKCQIYSRVGEIDKFCNKLEEQEMKEALAITQRIAEQNRQKIQEKYE